jgi:REP element-mobilizing transposase RayT
MDYNSLAHTTWECKYHIVFAPKFRRKIIYNQLRADIGRILSELCKRKGVEIIEAEACPDHIHMLVRIPPKYSVSEVMGYLKGKSSLMIRCYFEDDNGFPGGVQVASNRAYRPDYAYRFNDKDVIEELFDLGYRIGNN